MKYAILCYITFTDIISIITVIVVQFTHYIESLVGHVCNAMSVYAFNLLFLLVNVTVTFVSANASAKH